MEVETLLIILCIGFLAYLITMQYFKKKLTEEAARQERVPPKVEYGVKVAEKEIGYKPSVGTVCTVRFLLTSGKEIELRTGTDIYNNINKQATGTLKYIDGHIVSFVED